jgi:hypothetical protein
MKKEIKKRKYPPRRFSLSLIFLLAARSYLQPPVGIFVSWPPSSSQAPLSLSV